jgi:iron uptake system EfeUOB component EfeO/EfeM
MENGDAKPTDGAYKVFDELSAELKAHLSNLDENIRQNKSEVNTILTAAKGNEIE